MKKRIVAFLLSTALVITNILPVMADTTVIDLSSEAAELMQEDDLQDTVSANDREEMDSDSEVSVEDNYYDPSAWNGFIPSDSNYGFAERGQNGRSANDIEADKNISYPAKYDPRPTGVSGVRCQFLGSCWAYSALAAAESNLIKKGYADSSIDLSEMQLVYFMDHVNEDPLGNYTKDTEYKPDCDKDKTLIEIFERGGSSKAAVSFLSKWTGPILESQAPLIDMCTIPSSEYDAYYEQINNTTLGQELCANSSKWHFKGAKYCDYDIDHIDNVKELITNYGGVSMAYYSADSERYTKFFNEGEDLSYYFPYKAAANHAVELVGWDDNYSASNFTNKPAGDGAWLMKIHGERTILRCIVESMEVVISGSPIMTKQSVRL